MYRFIRSGAGSKSGERRHCEARARGYRFPHELFLLELDESYRRLAAAIRADRFYGKCDMLDVNCDGLRESRGELHFGFFNRGRCISPGSGRSQMRTFEWLCLAAYCLIPYRFPIFTVLFCDYAQRQLHIRKHLPSAWPWRLCKRLATGQSRGRHSRFVGASVSSRDLHRRMPYGACGFCFSGNGTVSNLASRLACAATGTGCFGAASANDGNRPGAGAQASVYRIE